MIDRLTRFGLALLLASVCGAASAQRLADMTTPTPLAPGSTLVIGFLGGYEPWNDPHRSVRQLVLKLRAMPGVYAESISNHHRKVALALIMRALDGNHDGKLSARERGAARVILFGQSWGGGATLLTAHDLEKMGIPVLLTVQVDSVGVHDAVVPANVRAAVNFYQHDPLTIQGREQIHAADPDHTRILGNFAWTYRDRTVDESNASLPRKVLGGSHAKMELDPEVWKRVEDFIDDAITGRVP